MIARNLMAILIGLAVLTVSAPSFGVTVSGRVELPDEVQAARDTTVNVRVTSYDQNGRFSQTFERDITVIAGDSSAEFSIDAEDVLGGSYSIDARWRCLVCDTNIWGDVYYTRFGSTPLLRTGSDVDQYRLSFYESLNGLVLKFSGSTTFSGSLSRPFGFATSQELNASAFVQVADRAGGSTRVIRGARIESGQQSSSFSFIVPTFENASYVLGYECQLCAEVSPKGYYVDSATAPVVSGAKHALRPEEFDAVSLEMIPSFVISGEIATPQDARRDQVIDVRVQLLELDSNDVLNEVPVASTIVAIPASQTVAPFRFDVQPDPLRQYIIRLSCFNCLDITESAYYSASESVLDVDLAERIQPDQDASNITISLLGSKVIRGKLMRPEPIDASERLFANVELRIFNQDGQRISDLRDYVEFEPGERSIDYEFSSAPDQTYSYILSYSCHSCSGVVSRGYYRPSGTVFEERLAEILDDGSALSSIDIEMLGTRTLSGSVKRPATGDTSQALTVNLDATSFINGAYGTNDTATVTIPQNQDSVDFVLEILPGDNISFRLSYYCSQSECDGVANQGYYTQAGTDPVISDDALVGADAVQSNIDFELLESRILSGLIVRPATSPLDQAISVSIRIEEVDEEGRSGGSYFYNVALDDNEASALFSVPITPIENQLYRVSYSCFNCDGINDSGWFNSTMTQVSKTSAEFISGSAIQNFTFPLLSTRTLTGSVFLPTGMISSEPIDVLIEADLLDVNSNFVNRKTTTVTIESGQQSSLFSVGHVPADEGFYRLAYRCMSCPGISAFGYYSQSGGGDSVDLADLIPVGSDTSAIDITMLHSILMSGLISRPVGGDNSTSISPKIKVVRRDFDGNYLDATSKVVTLDPGQNTANYQVEFPNNAPASYEVDYECSNCTGIAQSSSSSVKVTGDDLSSVDIIMEAQSSLPVSDRTISGSIVRPPGTDVSRALLIRVGVRPTGSGTRYLEVLLPASETETAFSLTVPRSDTDSYHLSYQCVNNCQEIFHAGYFDGSNMVPKLQDSFAVSDEAQLSDFQMQLIDQVVFSGRISLPPALPLFDGSPSLSIIAELVDAQGNTKQEYAGSINWIDGLRSKRYWLALPTEPGFIPEGRYRLSYRCSRCDNIVERGYLTLNGTTVKETELAARLDISSDQDNLDLELIQSNMIAGMLSRPASASLDSELQVTIVATLFDQTNNYQSSRRSVVVIPEGVRSIEYMSALPDNRGSVAVSYEYSQDDQYLRTGYFSGGATVNNIAQARMVNSDQSYVGLDMTLIPTIRLTGTLSRPGGSDNSDPIMASINVRETSDNRDFIARRSIEVVIPAGENSAAYSIPVSPPDIANYTVSYSCADCEGIYRNGFYTPGGTEVFAHTFTGDQGLNNIDLSLIVGLTYTGMISRPDGANDEREIEPVIFSNLLDDNGYVDYFFSTSDAVVILAGQRAAQYNLVLPPTESGTYTLRYQCDECDESSGQGYYSEGGTVLSFNEQNSLTGDALNNLATFEMIRAVSISGVLSRDSTDNGNERISAEVTVTGAISEFSSHSDTVSTIIESGELFKEYRAFVAPTAIHTARYRCESCKNTYESGYYTSSGTSPNFMEAEGFSVSGSAENIELSLIKFDSGSISGSLIRPTSSDTTQPYYVKLTAVDFENPLNNASGFDADIVIPVGETSADFLIAVPESQPFRLRYSCGLFCKGAASYGYYNELGTVAAASSAQALMPQSTGNIEFLMPPSRVVRGVLKRPLEADLTKRTEAEVFVSDQGAGSYNVSGQSLSAYRQSVVFLPGEEVANFSFDVSDAADAVYTLQYECQQCDSTYHRGFYSTSGTILDPDETIRLSALSSQLTDIEFNMLGLEVWSGAVNRAQGQPDNTAIFLDVIFESNDPSPSSSGVLYDFSFRESVEIEKGQSFVNFEVLVPPLGNRDILVSYRYSCSEECEGIVQEGFFSGAGTVISEDDAILLPAESPRDDLSLQLIQGASIDIHLDRPSLFEPAPPLDILDAIVQVELIAEDQSVVQLLEQEVSLGSDAYSTSPSIVVSKDDAVGYRLSYRCISCPGMEPLAYRSERGMVSSIEAAKIYTFEFGEDHRHSLKFLQLGFSDGDSDGVPDSIDNCSLTPNPDQSNGDEDQFGDICDTDHDNDLAGNELDNCPNIPNSDQANIDLDGFGDACDDDIDGDSVVNDLDSHPKNLYLCSDLDADHCNDCSSGSFSLVNDGSDNDTDGICDIGDLDDDNDGVADEVDNCEFHANSDQANFDNDPFGDACDSDIDGDTVSNISDSDSYNPLVCSDSDSDQCDDCSSGTFSPLNDGDDFDSDGLCDIGDTDDDADNVIDTIDNCLFVTNPDQSNYDGDSLGDACDLDDDNDSFDDAMDCAPFDNSKWQLISGYLDLDGDGFGDSSVMEVCSSDVLPEGYFQEANDNCRDIANADQLNTDDDEFGDACDLDDDNDTVADSQDNCVLVANADQVNFDMDAFGDACDVDDDNDNVNDVLDCAPLDNEKWQLLFGYTDQDRDGIGSGQVKQICSADILPLGSAAQGGDNCPDDFNSAQTNSDDDSLGDICDLDDDNDLILDDLDNCSIVSNFDQSDIDSDLVGDACDIDQDNDGVLNGADSNPIDPFACEDADKDSCDDCSIGVDGFGSEADNFPLNDGVDTNGNGQCDISDPNDDSDLYPDELDNCPLVVNDDQLDINQNGVGDACEILEDGFCMPIKNSSNSVVLICL